MKRKRTSRRSKRKTSKFQQVASQKAPSQRSPKRPQPKQRQQSKSRSRPKKMQCPSGKQYMGKCMQPLSDKAFSIYSKKRRIEFNHKQYGSREKAWREAVLFAMAMKQRGIDVRVDGNPDDPRDMGNYSVTNLDFDRR